MFKCFIKRAALLGVLATAVPAAHAFGFMDVIAAPTVPAQDVLPVASLGSMTLTAPNVAMNGAHSLPLMRRVQPGRKIFWAAGDWGRDDHGLHDGPVGLAEAGFGYNFGRVQLNATVGHTQTSQNLDAGGNAKAKGNYFMGEALLPVSGNLWLTLGAYGHWGDVDARRGYSFAGVPQTSFGSADTQGWGVRARMDWENAVKVGSNGGLTPYLDLSYNRMKLDRYTESGGARPLVFNARTDKSTELHYGLNARIPVSNSVRLVGIIEGAHRFERDGSRVAGQDVTGLMNFDVAGVSYKRNWARGGLGIEANVGSGVASVMLNATSRGEMPSSWIAASYQIGF